VLEFASHKKPTLKDECRSKSLYYIHLPGFTLLEVAPFAFKAVVAVASSDQSLCQLLMKKLFCNG